MTQRRKSRIPEELEQAFGSCHRGKVAWTTVFLVSGREGSGEILGLFQGGLQGVSVLVYPFVKNKVSRAHDFLFFRNSLPLRVWQGALASEPSAQNCQNNHFPTLEKSLRSIYP